MFLPILAVAMSAAKAHSNLSVETAVGDFMVSNGLPGCAVVILNNGQQVFHKGFGTQEAGANVEFRDDTLCPTASLSKTINGLAVLKLVESGKLRFDEPIIPFLIEAGKLKKQEFTDKRILSITMGDCLRNESGFGDAFSLFPTIDLQTKMAMKESPTLGQLADFALRQQLEFTPRSQFKYCNFNFQLLDLVISAASGIAYESAVQKLVFAPLGITDAKLFSSSLKAKAPNEAMCHDLPHRTGKSCLVENRGKEVPYSYGGIDYGPLHIWSLSANDLSVLYNGFPRMNGLGGLLKEKGRQLLFSMPAHDLGKDTAGNPANWYYSCGVWVNWTGQIGASPVYFAHSGNQSGSFAGFKGSWKGTTVIVVGNGNDERYSMADRLIDEVFKVL